MFCPKCGTQTIEETKFCRTCGADLETVSAALTGALVLPESRNLGHQRDKTRRDSEELMEQAIKRFFLGGAFIVIAILLTFTGYVSGHKWGFWLLIPGGIILSRGVVNYLKAKRIERLREELNFDGPNMALSQIQAANNVLPPQPISDNYMPSRLKTGELAMPPASITEETTRLLETDSGGETINLPSQNQKSNN